MNRRRFLQQTGFWVASAAFTSGLGRFPTALGAESSGRAATAGPLRVHPRNGRYFADAAGRVVYLTGAHTWNNLSDVGSGDPPTPFNFSQYLDFLQQHHHNFIRLWRWELTRWDAGVTPEYTPKKDKYAVAPHPWKRTGPGLALDGQPKFDLEQFDPAYFDRLRQRVRAAHERGIYVSVMLFEGWGLQHLPDAWTSHPFHPSNNIQALDGDAGGDGRGLLTHTLKLPAVTRLQEAYVRQVIDTVNDLDNVLYEIINESGAYSIEWQYHMIRFIKAYQQGKPQQHPVGMTFPYSRDSSSGARTPCCSTARPTGSRPTPTPAVQLPHQSAAGRRLEGDPLRHRSPVGHRRQSRLGVEELPARPEPDLHGPLRQPRVGQGDAGFLESRAREHGARAAVGGAVGSGRSDAPRGSRVHAVLSGRSRPSVRGLPARGRPG